MQPLLDCKMSKKWIKKKSKIKQKISINKGYWSVRTEDYGGIKCFRYQIYSLSSHYSWLFGKRKSDRSYVVNEMNHTGLVFSPDFVKYLKINTYHINDLWFYDELDSFGILEFRNFMDVVWLLVLKTIKAQDLVKDFVPATDEA